MNYTKSGVLNNLFSSCMINCIMKSQKKILFWISNITIPLLLGLWIYLRRTSDTYVSLAVRELFRAAQLPEIPLRPVNHMFSRFARNFLCDMCWAYSLVFCIAPIADPTQTHINRSVWISSLFAVSLELMQCFPFVGGTFDVLDLVVEVIACAAAGMMIKKFVWRNK